MFYLLKLLHDGLVEHEADDEGDAHDQEEDGADDVHHQVHGEVTHLGDLDEVLLGCLCPLTASRQLMQLILWNRFPQDCMQVFSKLYSLYFWIFIIIFLEQIGVYIL